MAVTLDERTSEPGSVAGSEIDETLRLARLELENEIVTFRVWFHVAIAVVTGIAVTIGALAGGNAPWLPPVYFGCTTLVALAIRRSVRKTGPTAGATYMSIVFDVLVSAVIFPLNALLEHEEDFEGLLFGPWLCLAPMCVIVFLHSLRGDRRSLLFSTVISMIGAVFVVATSPTAAFDEASRTPIVLPSYRAMGPDEMIPLLILSASMLSLAGGLGWYAQEHARRRLKIHARVLRYVPDAAYEHVRSESTDGAIRAPGKLVEVTLLASDLRGFTAMTEKLKPQEVVDQLNEYHDAMCREIERNGGMLDKLIGDGELAVFGWRGGVADAGAAEAIACARAMRARLEALNSERSARSLPPLAMGVGVHTGWCVAGNIGAGKKLSFTYIGDAVNAASRIEGLTKELGASVIASEATVSRLPSREGMRALGSVTVRGKTEAMTLHAVE